MRYNCIRQNLKHILKNWNAIFLNFVAILIALIFSTTIIQAQDSISQKTSSTNYPMNITFKNITNSKIKECFLKVYDQYDALHKYDITLAQKPVKSSTMQAQPVLSMKSLFTGVKKFQIKLAVYVKDSQEIKVNDLPDEVLVGWFAHELGHLVDYEPRSNFGMMIYGFRYLTSKKYKRKVEHKADNIAVENGFASSIIATKRYILENDFLGDSYKAIINKYYMSISDVEVWMDDNHAPIEPKIEL